MNKKAQGISINVIIIAAIALLVLVILSIIFMGRMGTFGTQSKSCTTQGGVCVAGTDGTACPAANPTFYPALTCGDGQVCCVAPA